MKSLKVLGAFDLVGCGVGRRMRAFEASRLRTSLAFMSGQGSSGANTTVRRNAAVGSRGPVRRPAPAPEPEQALRVRSALDRRLRFNGRFVSPEGSDHGGGQAREVDGVLIARTELAVIVAKAVEAAKAEVERRSVELALAGAELVEIGFEVVGQVLDLVEPHDGGRALDAVDHPERLAEHGGVGRILFELQKRIVESADLLVGLVEVVGQKFAQVETAHRPPREKITGDNPSQRGR